MSTTVYEYYCICWTFSLVKSVIMSVDCLTNTHNTRNYSNGNYSNGNYSNGIGVHEIQ